MPGASKFGRGGPGRPECGLTLGDGASTEGGVGDLTLQHLGKNDGGQRPQQISDGDIRPAARPVDSKSNPIFFLQDAKKYTRIERQVQEKTE
jgi:hypothetical protein